MVEEVVIEVAAVDEAVVADVEEVAQMKPRGQEAPSVVGAQGCALEEDGATVEAL